MAVIISIPLVPAVEWVYGSTHQHTGYSTWWGYDGDPDTDEDDCLPITLEGPANPDDPFRLGLGYTVEELKAQALDMDIHWLAFSDHSYCIDANEFNTVKTDCQAVQDSSFTCLWGEELSAAEIVDEDKIIEKGDTEK